MSRACELMSLHLDALFTRNDAGRLLRVREHDGAPAPRFFLGQTASSSVRAYRHDISDLLRHELQAASADDTHLMPIDLATGSAINSERYRTILARDAPIQSTEAGPVFFFPDRFAVAGNIQADTLLVIGRGMLTPVSG